MTDLHSAIYAYTEKVQASTVNAEDSQDEDGHGDAELDTLLEQIGQLERQAECYQDLFAAGFCPQEVPADGNCGLWSVMSLRQGGCLGNAKEAAAQMKQERIALGRAWSQCSGNILWQQLWKYFGMESELTPEEISKAAQAKTQARAQATPAKTPPQNSKSKSKSACLDEMSPMKHLDPKKISECKPANLGKPKQSSDLVLRQPGPKTDKPKCQEKNQPGESEDAAEMKPDTDEEDWLGGEQSSSCGDVYMFI